jgi:hypothetical protein
MQWILQSSHLNDHELRKTVETLHEMGEPVLDIGLIPFSDEITNLDAISQDQPVIFLGSCKMVNLLHAHPVWGRGIFFDPNTFRADRWVEALGAVMLNHTLQTCYFSELPLHVQDEDTFIRPVEDLKAFSGEVVAKADLQRWMESKVNGLPDDPDKIAIILSTPVKLHAEWRCFIVNGQVVSGSQYRKNRQLNVAADLPKEVISFANKIANRWLPAPHVVMDIAQTAEGFRVVEFNCLNASGWYKTERHAVFSALKQALEPSI